MPHINNEGLKLIEEFEGEELRAYPDPASELAQTGSGSGEPWSIGFGHTANVHAGQTITHEQAVAFLKQDVGNAEREVAVCTEVVLTPNQFSALVSFEYNTGSYRKSTLRKLVNQRKFAEAANEFDKWVFANGYRLAGLVRRRDAEKALFLKP
jgi:lysozyme